VPPAPVGCGALKCLDRPNFGPLASCEPESKAGKLSEPESNEREDLHASQEAELLLPCRHIFTLGS
jgi:hypothetical protein